MKRAISCIISLIMVVTIMPNVAFANNVDDLTTVENESLTLYVEQSNEIFEEGDVETTVEVIDVEPFSDIDEGIAPNGSGETQYAETVEKAADGLRTSMVERQANAVVNIKVDELTEETLTTKCSEIFTEATKHTGNPKEGDSLKWVWENWNCSISGTSDGTNCYATITYNISYYTTAEQEAALNNAVESLKTELDLDGKTDYEIIKVIYDYMVANITYDYTNLDDDSHKLKYTAYAALVNKTSVCQGYATLFYRLALEYGIDTRVIAGESLNNKGESERHSWNMVKLDDKYYYLDATWDSTWDSDKTTHDFFLKGAHDFLNHNASEDVVLWLENYDISSDSYKKSTSDIIASGKCSDSIKWQIGSDGVLTISGEGILKNPEELEYDPNTGELIGAYWGAYKKNIKKIVIESGITEISICTIIQLPNAEHIYIPETVETIEINQSFIGCPRLRFDVDSNNKWFSSKDGNLFNKSGDTILCMPRAVGDVIIPKGVEKIGPCIFNNYLFEEYDITSITMPDSVVEIGDEAFAHESNLNSVKLSPNLESIGITAFAHCKSLKEVQLPNKLKRIGMDAFNGCTGLNEITIPANVERIEGTAFVRCSNLENIIFSPKSKLSFIGYYCFGETPWLEESLKDGFVILNNILVACTGNEDYLVVPDEVNDICEGLAGCKSKTVVIPESVKRISSDIPYAYSDIEQIIFLGDKPQIDNENIWDNSTGESRRVEVYYPIDNETWEGTDFRCNADWWYTSEDSGTFGFGYYSLDENGEPITKHTHDMNKVEAEPATCTEDGNIEHYKCSKCEKLYIDAEGKTKITEEDTIDPATGHSYGSWKTDADNHWKECGCGDVIEKKPHNFEWIVDTKATDSKNGSKHQKCIVCNKQGKTDTIYKASKVILSKEKYTYDGGKKAPTVTVKDTKGKVIDKSNYSVSYASGRIKVGRYKVTITFKEDYKGTKAKTAYFTIVPKAPSSASANLYGYDDVKFSWSKSTGASGYYVYYKKSTSGKYTYLTRTTSTSIKKANLSDGVKYYFKVVPYYKSGDTRYSALAYKTASVYTLKKLNIPAVKKSGTKIKVSWKNIYGETGYQISQSTKSSGTKIVATYKTTKGTYKNLTAKKGTKYYYKVRAYKQVGKTKIYGPWSKVKSFKR